MVQPIDRAAFLAALSAAAQPNLQGVSLPGIGDCFKRSLTAGDVLDAEDVREALQAKGLVIDRKVNVAIGLAQSLCDESGRLLLDPKDPAHIQMLSSLPWATLRGVLMTGEDQRQEGDAPNA